MANRNKGQGAKINKNNTSATQDQTLKSISTSVMGKVADSLRAFSNKDEEARKAEFGDLDFLDQFWEYFQKAHPALLTEIEDRDQIKVYIESLEEKGFSVESLVDLENNSKKINKLSKTLGNKTTEKDAMQESLGSLCSVLEGKEPYVPAGTFKEFVRHIGGDFDDETKKAQLTSSSKVKRINDLMSSWELFAKTKMVSVDGNSVPLHGLVEQEAKDALNPNWLPTERLLISASMKKLRSQLSGPLQEAFDDEINTQINAFSAIQTLPQFANKWRDFLEDHKALIDEKLAKKLDKTIITNGDIFAEMKKSGIQVKYQTNFIDQEHMFKRVFNKLATHQLFEEVKETQAFIDNQLVHISDTFKKFPPYLSSLFSAYPFNGPTIQACDATFSNDIQNLSDQIGDIEEQISQTDPLSGEARTLRKQRSEIEAKMLERKWRGYIQRMKQEKPEVGACLEQLVNSKFDFSQLATSSQQILLNNLKDEFLSTAIDNQVPELLDVDQEAFRTFITDLLDLNKQSVDFSTINGPVHVNFSKKGFVGGPLKEGLLAFDNPYEIKDQINRLPLHFQAEVTSQNQAFFEENIVFSSLFTSFKRANGEAVKLHDSYKVRLQKDGKSVEGYLSQYAPTEALGSESEQGIDMDGQTWFLYSQPITSPSDERELVSWDGQGKKSVFIKKEDEGSYQLDVLEKKMDLTGDALGGLVSSWLLGQDSLKHLDNEAQKELKEKFKKLEVWKDTNEQQEEPKEENQEQQEENKEGLDYPFKDFLHAWREKIPGAKLGEAYTENNIKNKEPDTLKKAGFVKGTKLLANLFETTLEPKQLGGDAFMVLEVIDIDEKKGTCKLRAKGGERKLGSFEKKIITLSLRDTMLMKLSTTFDGKLYKLPKSDQEADVPGYLSALQAEDPTIGGLKYEKSFHGINREGNGFVKAFGDIGKDKNDNKVVAFGYREQGVGAKPNEGREKPIAFTFSYNASSHTFLVEEPYLEYKQIMDVPAFLTFVASKKLQPMTKTDMQMVKEEQKGGPAAYDKNNPDAQDTVNPKRGAFSLNNIVGFFSTIGSKVTDGIKKYDEERTEDLTDQLLDKGRLFTKFGDAFGVFSEKWESALYGAGHEYLADRDNRIWKKIEKYQKQYEADVDFGGEYMWETYMAPILSGKKKAKNHYQVAAMLLATINKGKGPYSRNLSWAGKGMRVKILLGEKHWQNYLKIKKQKEEELKQNLPLHGNIWADQLKDEIVRLEMDYLVDCIDGRTLSPDPVDDAAMLSKQYSKKFAGELDTASKKFFSQKDMVEDGYNKNKEASFEKARSEFYRLIAHRPQQALGFLKIMADKMVHKEQSNVFKTAMMACMISGVFVNLTMSDTQGWFRKVCRTIGFLPGIWLKDPNHPTKLARLLDISTKGKFSSETKYDPANFTLDGLKNHKFIEREDKDTKKPGVFRAFMQGNLKEILAFMDPKTDGEHTMIEMAAAPNTPTADREILIGLIKNSNEKDEDVDSDLKMNPAAVVDNVFAKSHSLVDEITKFNEGEFRHSNKDELQCIQDFWNTVADDFPSGKLSPAKTRYFFDKFLNWFGRKGFDGIELNTLVRTLASVKKELLSGNKERIDGAKHVLWYATAGKVLKNCTNGPVPAQFIKALDAFVGFFENNLDTILTPDMIQQVTKSPTCVDDITKPYIIAPWGEYVDLKKNKSNALYAKEKAKDRQTKRTEYEKEKFLNKEIYEIADRLYKNSSGVKNAFDHMHSFYQTEKKDTKTELSHTLGGMKAPRLKNQEATIRIMNTINSVNPDEDLLSEEEEALIEEEMLEEEG